jgi:tetratricopeptide (TPR) repeat protein
MRARAGGVFVVVLLLLVPSVVAQSAGPERVGLDRVWVKGTAQPLEGTVVEETQEGYRFRMKGASTEVMLALDQVEKVELAPTADEVYARRAASLAVDDAPGRLELGRFCLEWNMLAEAERELTLAARAAPTDPEPYLLLARALVRSLPAVGEATGDPAAVPAAPETGRRAVQEKLLSVYERAHAAGLDAPQLTLDHALLLRALGAEREALSLLGGLARRLPLPPAGPEVVTPTAMTTLAVTVRLEQARLALLTGDAVRAAEAYAGAAAAAPSESLQVRAWVGLGLARLSQGDASGAADAFQQAASAAPGEPRPLVLRAQALLIAGDAAGALGLVERARALGDDSSERALCHALALAALGRPAEAEAPLESDAPSGPLLIARAFVSGLNGGGAEALAWLDAVASTAPRFAGVAHVVRAELLEAQGELPAAEEALRAAGRAGYDFGTVAARLMRVKRGLGRTDEAVRYARYAAALRPRDAALLCEVGHVHLAAERAADQRGDAVASREQLRRAREAFDQALAADPAQREAALGRAYLAYRARDFQAAEGLFREALRAHPDDAYAREALRRIERARSRRLWRDGFERPDAEEVRNRWLEDEAYGVEARVRGGALTLEGTQAHASWGRTRVRREVERERLSELRAVFAPGGGSPFRFGVQVDIANGGSVSFSRDEDDRLVVRWRLGERRSWSEPEVLGAWPQDGGAHTLAIAIDRDEQEVVLLLDDREVGRSRKTALARTGDVGCEVWLEAGEGVEVQLRVDEVRVFVERRDG